MAFDILAPGQTKGFTYNGTDIVADDVGALVKVVGGTGSGHPKARVQKAGGAANDTAHAVVQSVDVPAAGGTRATSGISGGTMATGGVVTVKAAVAPVVTNIGGYVRPSDSVAGSGIYHATGGIGVIVGISGLTANDVFYVDLDMGNKVFA